VESAGGRPDRGYPASTPGPVGYLRHVIEQKLIFERLETV